MTEVSFGEWLKRQRKGRGLTQKELAHQIGCAVITLRKIESEERRPSTQIVEQLAEVIGVPDDEQAAFQRFARGDWRAMPTQIEEEFPWRVATKSPHTNLPTAMTKLIGREQELSEVHEYLIRAEIRLVTLIGPPGIGKTRLSIEVARQCLSDFVDGVIFAGLASLGDPNLIAATVRQALGYMETQHLSSEQQVIQGIAEKRILIILDNCEHLIEDAALFASRLLSACPNLKILATSRELFRIPGEWLYALSPLKSPDENIVDNESLSSYPALMLFTERARAAQKDFTLTPENIKTVSSICSHLDGLPLAIELIAAQIRMHSPQSLLQKLNDRFIMSAQGTRGASSRQISLNHAISWSYDSLTPDEQRLFAYLSVFSGGFTLSAAETIFSEQFAETSVSDLVTSLLDKSLLKSSTDANDELRINMLATIHHFAGERLSQMSEFSEVRNWHLAYFIALAEDADAQTRGPNQREWLDRLEVELDNIRAALGWCVSEQKVESALRLFNALDWAWGRLGHFREKEIWCNKIRGLPNAIEYPALYASLLNIIGDHWLSIDVDIAKSTLEECHEICLKLGDAGERELARALCSLGTLALYNEENIEKARSYFEESLKLYQKYEDEQETAWLIFKLGALADAAEQYAEAEEKFLESLAIYQKVGNKFRIAHVLSGLGELARHQGDYEQAEIFWEQNLKIFQEMRALHALAYPYHALASVSFRQGNYDKARSLFKESLKLFRENRDMIGLAFCLAGLAGVLGIAGKPEQAARLFGASELIIESIGALEPADQLDFKYYNKIVRKQLTEVEFEKAWAEGHGMTTERAIIYALGE